MGAKDPSKKLTPKRATEIMALVCFEEGHKRFTNDCYMDVSTNKKPKIKHSDIVEKFEIKTFFSCTNSSTVKGVFEEN